MRVEEIPTCPPHWQLLLLQEQKFLDPPLHPSGALLSSSICPAQSS